VLLNRWVVQIPKPETLFDNGAWGESNHYRDKQNNKRQMIQLMNEIYYNDKRT
jgi:hypothetical protein